MPFFYMEYYFAENGVRAQLVVGTTQKKFKQMEPTIEDFINGLVQIKK
jgi:hypothetical protein